MAEVTIIDYKEFKNNKGEKFYAMIVEGDVTLVKSSETGSYYATSKKASVSTTFDEETIKRLLGKKLEGKVAKVQCKPYEFTVEGTGEVITLSHRYQFIPAGTETVQAQNDVVQEELVN